MKTKNKRALKKAVNIADLRLIAKSRAHKVSFHLGISSTSKKLLGFFGLKMFA